MKPLHTIKKRWTGYGEPHDCTAEVETGEPEVQGIVGYIVQDQLGEKLFQSFN